MKLKMKLSLKSKNHYDDAIVDMPLRLLIIAIVLAITIPLILNAFNYYAAVQRGEELQREVTKLADLAVQTYSLGLNGSLVADVTLPRGSEYIKVGASLTSADSCLIRYKMMNSGEQIKIVRAVNKRVAMTSEKNDTFLIAGTSMTVVMTKLIANYDINSDGFLNDFYILIKKRV